MVSEHPLTVLDSLEKMLSATANPAEPAPGGNEALPLPTLARRALLPTRPRDEDTPGVAQSGRRAQTQGSRKLHSSPLTLIFVSLACLSR